MSKLIENICSKVLTSIRKNVKGGVVILYGFKDI